MCRARLNRRGMPSDSGAEKGSAAVVAGIGLGGESFTLYCAGCCRHECGARSIRGCDNIDATWFQGYMGECRGSQLSVQRGMAVREAILAAWRRARFRISLCHGIRKSRCCDNVAIQRRSKLGCVREHMMERNGRFSDPRGDPTGASAHGSHDSAAAKRNGLRGVSRARPHPGRLVHRSRSKRRPAVIPGGRQRGKGIHSPAWS
jgi:hypothetical protein